MFYQCQTVFTFQHLFSLSLQSGESHRSRVIFPDCQISNFHFFFFRLGNCSWYHSFPKTTYFFSSSICDFTCNQLGHPPLPVNIFSFSVLTIVKNSFSEFSILFPRNFNFTLLGNYIWLLNFLVNPSRTTIDQYCLNFIPGQPFLETFILLSYSKQGHALWLNISFLICRLIHRPLVYISRPMSSPLNTN